MHVFVYINFIESIVFISVYTGLYFIHKYIMFYIYTQIIHQFKLVHLSAPTSAVKETRIPLKGAITRATVATADLS